ncbi:MAG: ATP-binding protein [Spirochaetia bacterium]|jgi:AAA+ ATPase superfamily predicted ATPase|nr:ATP-binding protein [Spirochaetia bacterium]
MFLGRDRELAKLEQMYAGSAFECAVIYGRRRVGKTTLIGEFIRNKKAIYYTATETSARENLESMSRAILGITPEAGEAFPVYARFQDALDAVHERAKTKRLIFVIDEYPYVAASYQGFSSLLQKQIDLKFKDSRLMLILCGSSMSFMEGEVLGYKSPLYGRRTAQFKIQPFGYFETRLFFPRWKPEEQALAYAVTGGVPQYLAFFDAGRPAAENIRKNFLDPNANLFEEPLNLLQQEVREPAQYNAVIKAIATGSTKSSEIADRTGLQSSALAVYLRNLISLGIAVKEEPVTGDSRRKTLYRIADSMFRFWYRFIPGHTALIQRGMAGEAWRRIQPQIPAFMGGVFEDICKEWLWRENSREKLPLSFIQAGRWWGNDKTRRQETEIDILAFSDSGEAIIGECKWTGTQVSAGILQTLEERSGIFPYKNKFLYLFSKSGFTAACKKRAAQTGARLVSFAQMNS